MKIFFKSFSTGVSKSRRRLLSWLVNLKILFLFFLLFAALGLVLNSWKVKKVECQGISEDKTKFMAELIESSLKDSPLLFVSRPEVEKIVKPLYLWQVVSIKKQFPSTLEVSCRFLNNKAYFYLVDLKYRQPRVLADWYQLNRQAWQHLKLKRPYLLIFDLSQNKLVSIPRVLRVGQSTVVFSSYSLGENEYQLAWEVFNWLKEFDPNFSSTYKVFILGNNVLVNDGQRKIVYLLAKNSFPQPSSFRQFLDSLSQPYPLLLDWRGEKLVSWR